MRPIPPPPSGELFEDTVRRLENVDQKPRARVVISHLFIEYYLDWIVPKKLEKSEKAIEELMFKKKLFLIGCKNILSAKLLYGLDVVNKIRNHFAHNIDIESEYFDKEFGQLLLCFHGYNHVARPNNNLAF
jgi:hypothetical protein